MIGAESTRSRASSGRFSRFIDAANHASLGLQEAFGFRQVGYLPSVGYEFGHWTDTVDGPALARTGRYPPRRGRRQLAASAWR